MGAGRDQCWPAAGAGADSGGRSGANAYGGAVPYAEVDPAVVKARLSRGEEVFLLDVREPAEVAAWSYPVGVNIPLGELGERLDELPRDVTITVACHVGGRSAVAAEALSGAGWAAENLTGGAVAWAADDEAEAAGA